MIAKKLHGYKSQDKKFEIYSEYHCIKHDEVEQKLKEYNFLQGSERYKYELGGKDFFVYSISLSL